MMKLYDEGEKLTKEQINNYEKILDIQLPRDYIEFILESNGGTPEEDLVFDFYDVVEENNNTTDIREFYVFYNEAETSFDDIIKVNGNIKDEKMLPESCFVFADDSAGNPICINTSGEDVGSVYFCNQDYEDEDTGYLAMSKVADSFKEFIEKNIYIGGINGR